MPFSPYNWEQIASLIDDAQRTVSNLFDVIMYVDPGDEEVDFALCDAKDALRRAQDIAMAHSRGYNV